MVTGNHFLDSMGAADYGALAPNCRRVRLARDQHLAEVGEPVSQLVLPVDSVISVLVQMQDGELVETRTIGRESGFGLLHALGGPQSYEAVTTQIGGDAYLIDRRIVVARARQSPALTDLIVRHAQATLVQTGQSVACNALHEVRQRLCRWLLITQDRLQRPQLPLKQEHLACMLGVQRTTVTAVASRLQSEGAIRYRRGMVTVCDREQLLAGACECYRAVEERACWFLAEEPTAYFGAGA